MLITRKMLRAVEISGKDKTRDVYMSVFLTPDGQSAVATDGHMLAVVTPNGARPPAEEYPLPAGLAQADPPAEGLIIPAETCKAALKSLPKKTGGMPVLRCASLVQDGAGAFSIFSTDLKTPHRNEFKPIDGVYPKFGQMIPDINKGDFRSISINAKLLISLLNLAMDGESNAVTLHIQAGRESPMVVTSNPEAEEKVVGVLMPLRI